MKKRKLWISIMAGFLAAVMLLTLIVSLIPAKVSAASSSEIRNQINDLKEQKEELADQMEEVQNQYKENEDEILDVVARKNVIDQEIFLLYQQIVIINEQLAAYNLLIADKQEELDAAQARLDELSAKNKERIRTMEEDGSLSYWEVLFKANSFADLLDRMNMIEEIAASDKRRLDELSRAAEDVAMAKAELEAEKAELDLAKAELDAANAELAAKQQEANELLEELIEKGAELEALYEGFELEEEALMAEIARKEQEYNEAKHNEWLAYMATYTTVPPETTAPPTTQPPVTQPPETNPDGSTVPTTAPPETQPEETKPSGGGNTSTNAYWIRPCSYVRVSSPFGNRDQPTAGASTYHQGIDLAGPEGTPIYAARTGVVTIASYSNSAGYYVTINHGDGFSSIYMHMTGHVVSGGQAVSAGQLIGYMGSTGISTGSHLHFGIAYNGVYVNPAAYIGF